MNSNTFFLLLGAILCSVLGQVLLKAGANALGVVRFANLGQQLLSMTTQPLLWAGLTVYGFSSIGYIIVLSRAKLSAAAPLLALSYVLTLLAATLVFGETISLMRWLGVGCIMVGVVLILKV
jgi:drug/metabolite transporter (DMT)-like permease